MKLRLWPRRRVEPPAEEAQQEAPPAPPTEPEQTPSAAARPRQHASTFARPYAPDAEEAPALPAEPPASASLTLEEAKAAIRAAGGDVIQIGFLANAYLRHRADEPGSRETAAARERLRELVATRLKDRKLLAPQGRLELLEEPEARNRTA
jgi:hypothetical protein